MDDTENLELPDHLKRLVDQYGWDLLLMGIKDMALSESQKHPGNKSIRKKWYMIADRLVTCSHLTKPDPHDIEN